MKKVFKNILKFFLFVFFSLFLFWFLFFYLIIGMFFFRKSKVYNGARKILHNFRVLFFKW